MDLTGMAPSSWGGRASSNERQGILAWTTAPSAAEANAASSTSTDNAPERLARRMDTLERLVRETLETVKVASTVAPFPRESVEAMEASGSSPAMVQLWQQLAQHLSPAFLSQLRPATSPSS